MAFGVMGRRSYGLLEKKHAPPWPVDRGLDKQSKHMCMMQQRRLDHSMLDRLSADLQGLDYRSDLPHQG